MPLPLAQILGTQPPTQPVQQNRPPLDQILKSSTPDTRPPLQDILSGKGPTPPPQPKSYDPGVFSGTKNILGDIVQNIKNIPSAFNSATQNFGNAFAEAGTEARKSANSFQANPSFKNLLSTTADTAGDITGALNKGVGGYLSAPIGGIANVAGDLPGAQKVSQMSGGPAGDLLSHLSGQIQGHLAKIATDHPEVAHKVNDALNVLNGALILSMTPTNVGDATTGAIDATKGAITNAVTPNLPSELYHGASAEGAEGIKNGGFKTTTEFPGSGSVNLTTSSDAAKSFAGDNGHVIPVKVNADNVLKFDTMEDYTKAIDAQKGLSGSDAEAKVMGNNDAIYIKNGDGQGNGMVMVKNPENVSAKSAFNNEAKYGNLNEFEKANGTGQKGIISKIGDSLFGQKIPKQVQTALGETSGSTFNTYSRIGKLAEESYKNPTPLEYAGTRAGEALNTIQRKLDTIGSQKSSFLEQANVGNKPVGNIVTKFRQNLSNFLGTKTTVEGDSKLIRDISTEAQKLGNNPTAKAVDKFIDFAQDRLYTSGRDLTVPVTDSTTGTLRKFIGELNTNLKSKLPESYRNLNSQYADIVDTKNELNTKLGPEGERGGSLMKRVFSPSDANTKNLFAKVKTLTGVDLVNESTIARYVMESLGDTRQASMLHQLQLPKMSKTGMLQFVKDLATKKFNTPEAILDRARELTSDSQLREAR